VANISELKQGPSRQPRDFLIDMLRGLGTNKHTARSFGDKIFGTQDRMGFIDVTPFGVPEAARKSTKALGEGNLMQALIEGLGVIPGGVMKQAAKPIGSMATVMLRGGRSPLFGKIDEADKSLAMTFGGPVRRRTPESPEDFDVVLNTAIPDEGEVIQLGEQINPQTGKPFLNERQVADTISGPRLRFSPGIKDELLLRGLKPGSATRSGVVTGSNTKRNILDAIGAAARTAPLEKAGGAVTGSRVTGGKYAHGGPPAAIDLGLARRRAVKERIKPAQDLTLPEPSRRAARPLKENPITQAIIDRKTGRTRRDDPFTREPRGERDTPRQRSRTTAMEDYSRDEVSGDVTYEGERTDYNPDFVEHQVGGDFDPGDFAEGPTAETQALIDAQGTFASTGGRSISEVVRDIRSIPRVSQSTLAVRRRMDVALGDYNRGHINSRQFGRIMLDQADDLDDEVLASIQRIIDLDEEIPF
jgi:hypothetical protein